MNTLQLIYGGACFGVGLSIGILIVGCAVTLLLVAWDEIRDQSRAKVERRLFEMPRKGVDVD